MRCDADAVSFAFTGEGADRPNRSPSSNFGKAPPLRRQDQERGSFLPSACRFCSVQGPQQGSSQLRSARRHGISRGIHRSIGSVHARARRHRACLWSSSGDRESRARRIASHVTAIMNAALSRARRSGPVLAPISASGSLADAARDLAVCLLREMARRKGAVENVATKGVIFIRTQKSPCHPDHRNPFLLASGFRLNAGLVL